MWRTLFPIIAVIVPVLLGLTLVYFFIVGAIGTATVLAAFFALAAYVVTAIVLHGDLDEHDGESPPELRL